DQQLAGKIKRRNDERRQCDRREDDERIGCRGFGLEGGQGTRVTAHLEPGSHGPKYARRSPCERAEGSTDAAMQFQALPHSRKCCPCRFAPACVWCSSPSSPSHFSRAPPSRVFSPRRLSTARRAAKRTPKRPGAVSFMQSLA